MSNIITANDLEECQIFQVFKDGKLIWIFRCDEAKTAKINWGIFEPNTNPVLRCHSKVSLVNMDSTTVLKEATEKQKEWLIKSIQAAKLIPYEEIELPYYEIN